MDILRLNVAPATPDAGGGFQVEVFVNDVEMTSAGAGMGMDPYRVLVPDNRLLPREEPHTTPIACCTCGVYGCGATDVTISRDGDVVHWDWQIEKPMDRRVTFDASQYLTEVTRAADDHSWETPEREAGRLVLSAIKDDDLPDGVTTSWVANRWEAPHLFRVCLQYEDVYQIFVDFAWADRGPAQLAEEVLRVLITQPPESWPASWHSMVRSEVPPPMAGPHWAREQY